MKRSKRGFTLAEVLITLAIIGVVAAISIPSVISNSQQQEFKTGLRKAVSVLNSAITMNMAIDGETPYDNKELAQYLMRHMSILKTTNKVPWYGANNVGSGSLNANSAFYTTDGMRFEFEDGAGMFEHIPLHETTEYKAHPVKWDGTTGVGYDDDGSLITNKLGCGSLGLANNPDNTTQTPCFLLVDVNGDRKPTPGNINCTSHSCANQNKYIVPVPQSKKVNDIFLILITENRAFPYGITAQKAMYEAQK